MSVRLTVHRAQWDSHRDATAAAYGNGLVPVVKGNGYGFGRALLHEYVAHLPADAGNDQPTVCVGTVHELHDVPHQLTPVVLTPTLTAPASERPVLTVGSIAHVRALAGWRGSVIVKLASSMRRFGATPDELPELLTEVATAGLRIHAVGLHLPLVGDDAARLGEVEAWIPHLTSGTELWLSHLEPQSFRALQAAHPSRGFRIRVGTALWHDVPRQPFLHLTAEVLHVQTVRAGDVAGYFHSVSPHDATLVVIGGGSAHGITATHTVRQQTLGDSDPTWHSPFHFARRRMPVLEPPHMHSTLALVPHGQPCPQVGERVDVQRPLISTAIEEIEWK